MLVVRSLSLAILLAATAQAQVAGARADLADPLAVVAHRSVQVDASVDHEPGPTSQTDVGTLVRWGLRPGLEVRAGIPTYSRSTAVSGLGDPVLGAKAELGAALGWAVAATAEVSLPLGGALGSGRLVPLVGIDAGRDLAASFVIDVAGELALLPDAQTPAVGGAAVTLTRPVAGPVEASLGLAATVEDLGVSALVLEHEYAFLVAEQAQFGAYVAIGLEGSAAPGALYGLRVSVRR